MVALAVAIIAALVIFSVLLGDWTVGGGRAVRIQHGARRSVLIVTAVVVGLFLIVAWSGGFATI